MPFEVNFVIIYVRLANIKRIPWLSVRTSLVYLQQIRRQVFRRYARKKHSGQSEKRKTSKKQPIFSPSESELVEK